MLFTIVLALTSYAEAKRYEQHRRIDLYVEALIACKEDKRAMQMANELLPLQREAYAPFTYITNTWRIKYKYFGADFDPRLFDWGYYKHFAGENVFVPTDVFAGPLVRADKCTVEAVNRRWWFVAVRSELKEEFRKEVRNLPGLSGEWDRSVVLVNGDVTLPRLEDSLIICDGNVTITHGTKRSVVIANGRITWPGGDNTHLYATGKIYFGPYGKDNKLEPELTELPFGVKFLDLKRDFGLEVTNELDVKSDCPALKLKQGDAIAKIDGAITSSIPMLRDRLRRGIVRGSATMEVRRGNKFVTQTVAFNGFLLPLAPMPREVKK